MNPGVILALIIDLYGQVSDANVRCHAFQEARQASDALLRDCYSALAAGDPAPADLLDRLRSALGIPAPTPTAAPKQDTP